MELFSLTTNITITNIRWQAYPIGVFILLLCLFTIFCNTLLIYFIIKEKTLHSSTYYYIGSLALSDLLVGLIAMPFAFIFEMTDGEYWLFEGHLQFVCDFWHSIDIFASTASLFALCIIALDRYIAIKKPIAYSNSFLTKKWYYILSSIWICSAILSFPAVIYFGTAKGRSSISNESITITTLVHKECEFPDNPYYILFISIVSFFLPLMIMIYVYIKMYVAARKQALALRIGYKQHHCIHSTKSFLPKFRWRENFSKKKSEIISENDRTSDLITLRIHHGKYHNPNMKSITCSGRRRKGVKTNSFWRSFTKDQKAAKFIGIIMGAFIICWLPYFVYLVLSGVFVVRLKDDGNHELLFNIFSWLGYTNSVLDVVVYVSTSKELQTIFFKLFVPRSYV